MPLLLLLSSRPKRAVISYITGMQVAQIACSLQHSTAQHMYVITMYSPSVHHHMMLQATHTQVITIIYLQGAPTHTQCT
jgi:hypothetical protein